MSLPNGEVNETVVHDESLTSLEKGKDNTASQMELSAFQDRKLDFRTIMAIIALSFCAEANILGFVLPAAVLLNINEDIGPSNKYSWIATAWTLAGAVTQPIAGRSSDIFGRRNFMICGSLTALVGTIIAAQANSISIVIVGTTFMGVASSFQLLSFACVNEIVPKKSRGNAIGFMNVVALPGSAFGSVIAFAMVAKLSWRWTFHLGTIINGFALVLVLVFYWPPPFIGLHPEGKTRWQMFKELDFIGLLLFGGGLTSFLLGISFGNNPYPWTSANVLVPLLIGGLTFFVGFPAWEVYGPNKFEKLCPPEIFRNTRGFCLPLITLTITGMMLICLQVLWPQQIQTLFTTVPRTVGWYSLAYNLAAASGAVTCGLLFARIKRTQWQFLTVIVLETVFITALAAVNQHTPVMAIVFVSFASFFVGASQFIGLLIIQFGVADEHIGVGSGLSFAARSVGGAIGLAIYSSILNNKILSHMAPKVSAAALKAGLPASQLASFLVALTSGLPDAFDTVKGVTPAIIGAGVDALKSVYSNAYEIVFLVSLAFGIIACISATFISSVDHKLTNQVGVTLDEPHMPGTGGERKAKALHALVVHEEG